MKGSDAYVLVDYKGECLMDTCLHGILSLSFGGHTAIFNQMVMYQAGVDMQLHVQMSGMEIVTTRMFTVLPARATAIKLVMNFVVL